MTARSFIVANSAAAAFLLLLINCLTCVVASPFSNSQSNTTTLLTQPQLTLTEKIRTVIGEPESDRMINTPAVTTGTCQAILPDGRLQTVIYTCAPTGYSAVVQFHKPGNQSATHERNQTTNDSASAPVVTNATQQHLQPITGIVFRSSINSSRITTESEKTTERESSSAITTTVAASSPLTKKIKLESLEAIVPPHRFHAHAAPTGDKVPKDLLVQLQPSPPLSTTPATRGTKGRHRSTTLTPVDVTPQTPAAIRRRKMRLHIPVGGRAIQSESPL